MMSKTHRGPIVLALLVGLLAGLALVATADDQQLPAKEEKAATEETAAVLETAETATPQVYHTNGVTISWDSDKKAFASPTAEQFKLMAEQFNKMVEAKFAGGLMPSEDKVVVETLENGIRRVRLPASQLTASVVRMDENGNFVVGECADGAENTAELLKAPVRSKQWEEK